MWQEFKQFAIKGNAMDLAVGIIIGAAFTSVVNSVVQDVLNPILDIFIGRVDFRNITIGLPGDSVLGIGAFLNAAINFLIVAFAVFLLVKQLNRFRRKTAEPAQIKQCPYCFSEVNIKATRCAQCTSSLIDH